MYFVVGLFCLVYLATWMKDSSFDLITPTAHYIRNGLADVVMKTESTTNPVKILSSQNMLYMTATKVNIFLSTYFFYKNPICLTSTD